MLCCSSVSGVNAHICQQIAKAAAFGPTFSLDSLALIDGGSIRIESALRLPAEPAGGDVRAKQWAWAILRVADAVVQHLEDRQARIEADQVRARERAERMVHPE